MALKNKYRRQKRQYSTDSGQTWTDVYPAEYRKGELLEEASADCNTSEWREVEDSWLCVEQVKRYRWIGTDTVICDGYDSRFQEKEQVSTDNGITWTDTGETRNGSVAEYDSTECTGDVDFSAQYLTIEPLEDTYLTPAYLMDSKEMSSKNAPYYFSIDGGETWKLCTDYKDYTEDIFIEKGTKILLKREFLIMDSITVRDENTRREKYSNLWVGFCGIFGNYIHPSDPDFKIYGNVGSIIFGDNFENAKYDDIYLDADRFPFCGADDGYGNNTLKSAYNMYFPKFKYLSMYRYFYLCYGLIKAPKRLEAVYDTYLESTFNGCKNLEVAPELTATTTLPSSYSATFEFCEKLNRIKMMLTDEDIQRYTNWGYWTRNVASSGTFIKNCDAQYDEQYAVPSGWTVQCERRELRWVTVQGEHICVGYDKYAVEKEQLSTDGGNTWSDTGETRQGPLIEVNSTDCGYTPAIDYSTQYLTFEVVEGGTVTIRATESSAYKTIWYSLDSGTSWTEMTSNTIEQNMGGTLSPGDKVMVKGTNGQYNSGIYSSYTYFGGTAKVNLYGNIMSLVYGDDFEDNSTLSYQKAFRYLFIGNTGILSAENLVLPATNLTINCYYGMFSGCRNLMTAPSVLPATTLANYCYDYMFNNCTSLVSAPELSATTLANYCCEEMFRKCTSLTTAPELPATTLAQSCYQSMFVGCTSLTTAPSVLPATTLAQSCYDSMFSGCTSLTSTPRLPATTLSGSCYQNMFYGCTSLTTAPALPATTLADGCYSGMFEGCTSLATAPELPATTLAYSCYYQMFTRCTSLVAAPELPATTLVNMCYNTMFSGCTSLNYIKAMFTTTPSTDYTSSWVYNVASTGTFVKNSEATWDVSGAEGIPEGWTVVTE